MKKAAILTWCDNNGVTNYGQVLQCYALYSICTSLGYDTEIIYYRNKDERDVWHGVSKLGIINRLYERYFKIIIIEKKNNKRIRRFRRFIKKNIVVSKPFYDERRLKEYTKDYDVLICGSDQIWNPLWYKPAFALSFASANQKRIAYAPSGVIMEDDYSNGVYREIAGYIDKFDAVSVREDCSVDILKKYTTKEITSVLDPSMLLTEEEWKSKMAKRQEKEPYIFCYTLGALRKYKHILKYLMKRCGAKKVLYIPTNLFEESENELGVFKAVKDAGLAEFLSLIYYAEYVCTDSYHGMAMSLKFGKQFCTLGREQDGSEYIASEERQKTLLKKVGVENRKVNCKRDVDSLSIIDFFVVGRNLNYEIDSSMCYIVNSII